MRRLLEPKSYSLCETRVQGPKHFETVNAEWIVKTLHRVVPMPKDDRAAFQSASAMSEQAKTLWQQGKYAAAQPLYEKALEIRRRLLTDDHPDTASSYNDLAINLNFQGKYASAQPLLEKALEIRHRLHSDDQPGTARGYNDLALNLNGRGSTRRPSRFMRSRWSFTADFVPTTTPTPP